MMYIASQAYMVYLKIGDKVITKEKVLVYIIAKYKDRTTTIRLR